MCFSKQVDVNGRVHSTDFLEGREDEEVEAALSRWDEENPDKERIAWIPRQRLNKCFFVIEFILKEGTQAI